MEMDAMGPYEEKCKKTNLINKFKHIRYIWRELPAKYQFKFVWFLDVSILVH